MTRFLIALVSGLIMLWSLFQVIRHNITEFRMGGAIRRRLRGSTTFATLLGSILREPLLSLSKEAAPLSEKRTMMKSYWMKGLWGLIFLVSLFVFAASTGFLAE
jgi:hypothetical protein